jgi:hypothetical protein
MKTQEIKRQNSRGREIKKTPILKHSLTQKATKKTSSPPIFNEYDEIEILQEFFTHPNYLDDYLA